MANQFSVDVPNALQALTQGEQGYQETSTIAKNQALQANREVAAQAMQGGDYKGAVSRLLQGGDYQGANTIASMLNSQDTHAFQKEQLAQSGQQSSNQLAESKRHNLATEANAAKDSIKPFQIGTDGFGAPIYGTKDSTTGQYVPINIKAPQQQAKAAPQAAFPNAGTQSIPSAVPTSNPTGAPLQMQAPMAGGAGTAGGGAASGGSAPTGDKFLSTLEPGQSDLIKKIANYEMDPRVLSIRGGHRERVLSAVAQYDPAYDAAQYPARQRAVTAFGVGKQGDAVRSFNVAIDHLDTIDNLGKALDNGDIKKINQIKNYFKEQVGEDAPGNFDAAKNIVGAEVSKAIIGSQNALQDRQELRDALQNARSYSQLSGVIKSYKTLMGGQLKGYKQQYEDSTRQTNFESKLSPNVRAQFFPQQAQTSSSSSNVPPPPPGFVMQ